jgi:hypothetical protein
MPIMKRTSSHIIWAAALGLLIHGADVCGRDISSRFTVGAVVGNWQPHSLNDAPRFSGFGAAGATPFYGLNLILPIGGETGLRFSVAYWSLHDLNKVEAVHTLTLHPVSLDLKYWLVPDSRLSAYVLYGGSAVFGIENEASPFGNKIKQARSGWGVNLGAGFDLALSNKIGLGALFQYHFVRFKQPLGGVDDFSGPKIAGEILLFL